MAKKVVASLKASSKNEKYVKVIKMVKSPKTGAYMFAEEVMPDSKAGDFFKK